MPSSHPLGDVFLRTTYYVRPPAGGRAAVRIGEPLPRPLRMLLPDDNAVWGFITACNPRGLTRSPTHNRRAMRALRDAFREHAPQACLRAGYGALGTWREQSLFVTGVSLALLDTLMQQFDQLAIVHGRGDQPARLKWSPHLAHAVPAPR